MLSTAGMGAGCSDSQRVVVQAPKISEVELSQLARWSLYFGHQSVGGDILAGVRQLLKMHPEANLDIRETANPAQLRPGVWAHGLIGRNEDPSSKIQAFTSVMEQGLGDSVDVAFFKLCYIDFKASTDPSALFAEYEKTMDDLRTRFPRTAFLHATVPLTTVQTGAKAWIKTALGRAVWGEAENLRRGEFNDLMRKRYGSHSVFDLAKLESTYPDGRTNTANVNGRSVQVLVPAYTYDGGHLTHEAQAYVGAHLIRFLAERELPTAAGGVEGGDAESE